MNNRFLTTLLLTASSAMFVTGCSNDSPFETQNTSGTPDNDGLISQNNFTILFSDPKPQYLDLETGDYTSVTTEVTVQIGDNNNQLITGSHQINFRTEWGLIDPYCTTEGGSCSVTWRSGSPDDMPDNFRNNILAYSSSPSSGQESYGDVNGNGLFDDGDLFNTSLYRDLEEPFLNVDESYDGDGKPTFTSGDRIVDTINGRDLTGADATHNEGDGLFNGPNCSHTTLCSDTNRTITVWESGSLLLIGDVEAYSIGGTVTGLAGTVILQNNGGDDFTMTADGTFFFTTPVVKDGTYSVTVLTQPAGQTCNVTNGSGTATATVTDVTITCT